MSAPTTQATRHACACCAHTGAYSGPGPHTCPGCGELLQQIRSEPETFTDRKCRGDAEGPPRRSDRELLCLALAALHEARSAAVSAADALDTAQERIEAVLLRLAGGAALGRAVLVASSDLTR